MADGEDDPLQYGPRPEDLVPRAGAAGVGGAGATDGVYVPPKLNPVAMEVLAFDPADARLLVLLTEGCRRS